jgi:Tfp pilus assembly protein PilF
MGEALGHLARAVMLRPDHVDAHRFLAQIYLTRGDSARAMRHLEEAVRLTRRQDPALLEMLSSAQAGAGRRADAIASAREALNLALADGNAGLVSRLEQRIRGYER